MKICCPKNNWISFEWIFKKYHAHSNYICTDLEGFASEKFKLFKSHSKISKKRPWTPPTPNFQEGFVWSRQDNKFISFSSKQATEFKTKLKFPDLLRVEPVQDSEDTLTNIANIYHRKFVSYYLQQTCNFVLTLDIFSQSRLQTVGSSASFIMKHKFALYTNR